MRGSLWAARLILRAVLVMYAAIVGLNVHDAAMFHDAGTRAFLICLAFAVVLFTAQLFVVSRRPRRWPLPARVAILCGQAVLTYLPLVLFGLQWGSMAGLLAGTALLLLRGVTAWAIFGAVIASMSVAAVVLLEDASLRLVNYFTLSSVMLALVVWGFTRFVDQVDDLTGMRRHLAHMAVLRERRRFAEDLHNLVATRVSVIAIKSAQISTRLRERKVGALEEIGSVADTAARALSDARRVSASLRELAPVSVTELWEPASGADHGAYPPPRMARAIVVFLLGHYTGVVLLNVHDAVGTGRLPAHGLYLAAPLAVVLVSLQFVLTRPTVRMWSRRRRMIAVAAQVALTLLPLVYFGHVWATMAGALFGTAFLLVGRWAWSVLAGTTPILVLVQVNSGVSPTYPVYAMLAIAIFGVTIWGFSRLIDIAEELRRLRAESTRFAIERERLRFSRDVHDLLGSTLSTIAMKSAVAGRKLPDQPDRAAHEMQSVSKLATMLMAESAELAARRSQRSLTAEVALAVSTLQAADVSVEVTAVPDRIPPAVDDALAAVVREGIANMLKHSDVRRCRIGVSVVGNGVRLAITNDGIDGISPGDGTGRGLANLRTRLGEIGGRLVAHAGPGGTFTLTAAVPQAWADPAKVTIGSATAIRSVRAGVVRSG